MTSKDVFQMTISDIRNLIDSSDTNDLALMAAEVERRISKRKLSGKTVTKKYIECLSHLQSAAGRS